MPTLLVHFITIRHVNNLLKLNLNVCNSFIFSHRPPPPPHLCPPSPPGQPAPPLKLLSAPPPPPVLGPGPL